MLNQFWYLLCLVKIVVIADKLVDSCTKNDEKNGCIVVNKNKGG
jgi:hypothetical protein